MTATWAPMGEWARAAACKGGTTDMTMPLAPGRGGRITRAQQAQIRTAKLLCAECPVRQNCLAWAMTEPDPAEASVCGGLTPKERQQARDGAA